jgi:hypothetical protein
MGAEGPQWRAYWEARRGFRYYQEAVRLAREHVPGGGAVIDVGAHETEVLERLDWFERRVALDVNPVPRRARVETVIADFTWFEPRGRFDLALCLQVLEHLEHPGPFARKLLRTGRTAIISVPYRWPGWMTDEHVHDPVDESKLEAWTGREPTEVALVNDLGMERLLAVYRDQTSTRST